MIHHDFWWRFFPRKELTQLYISMALRSFALSLIAIFIPLYLLQEKNFSLEQVLLFFVFYSIIFAIATPLAAAFASRFGLKHAVLVSIPFYVLFMVLLYFLSSIPILILLSGSLLGTSHAFYWMGIHLVFQQASHVKHRGEEMGVRSSVTVVATMLGPLLGGILITTFGFGLTFGVAALVLGISAVVLFQSQERYTHYSFSLRSIFDKSHWQDSIFFVSRGSHVIVQSVLWPLFVFFILQSYFSLGIIGSLMSLTSVVLLWLVGRYSDHKDKKMIIRWTSVLESIVFFFQSMVNNVVQIVVVTIFFSVIGAVREAPLGALEYDKARGQIAGYFVSREISICLGRILVLTIVLVTQSISGGILFQAAANFAVFLF